MLEPILNDARLFVPAAQRRRRHHVFREVYVASGVADIVIVNFDAAELRRRRTLGLLPVENYSAIAVLATLRNRHGMVSPKEIAERVSTSREHLRRVTLPLIANAGYLRRNGDHWQLHRCFRPIARSIFAVEVKRMAWRRAAHQARTYLRFANAAFVALDASRVRRLDLAAVRSVRGIGLVRVLHTPPTVHVVKAARVGSPDSFVEFALAGERLLALELAGLDSGPVNHVFGRRVSAEDSQPLSKMPGEVLTL